MNRKVFLGCGGVAAFLVAALVGAIFFGVPLLFKKGKSWMKTQMAEGERVAAFERNWQPPSDTPDAQWFPPTNGDWQRGSTSVEPGFPALNIEREVHRAAYKNGTEEIVVAVVAANELEKEAMFARAKEALEGEATTTTTKQGENYNVTLKKTGSRWTTSSDHQLSVRTGGVNHTRLWWVKGWLFVFRAHGGTDPEAFMEPFLAAMQKQELEAR